VSRVRLTRDGTEVPASGGMRRGRPLGQVSTLRGDQEPGELRWVRVRFQRRPPVGDVAARLWQGALEFPSMMLASRSHDRAMAENGIEHLRVLIANERRDRLELLAQVVAGLGHEVIAREIDVKEVGPVTAKEHPDVALVGLGLSSEHALELIGEIVREASCPVIALLAARDPAYVHEAAKRGVFAYIIDATPEELQSAIDITLQRFAEYHSLQGAFGRRALIEQAKGILMARHSTNADRAFEMLRDHSQHNGHKLIDVAQAIVDSHLLLQPPLQQPALPERPA
jgi:AmiR/NasT family two-component response regulator